MRVLLKCLTLFEKSGVEEKIRTELDIGFYRNMTL